MSHRKKVAVVLRSQLLLHGLHTYVLDGGVSDGHGLEGLSSELFISSLRLRVLSSHFFIIDFEFASLNLDGVDLQITNC